MDPADADRRVHRRRRHADARGDARGRAPRRASTRRRRARCSARCSRRRRPRRRRSTRARRTAWRRSTGTSSRSTTASPTTCSPLRDPVQPRESAPRAGVRHAQDHLARGGDQARPARRARARQPRRRARLGLREGLRRGDVADAPAGQARGLRDRHGRDEHRARCVEVAFDEAGLDWERYVRIDEAFKRPAEVDQLIGDPSKAKRELGWEPQTSFEELIRLMVRSDLELLA